MAGAEACDGPVGMAERVEVRLGRPVFVRTPDAVLVVEGRVSQTEQGGYVARLRISDPGGEVYGERALQVPPGQACEQLDALSALVIAITLRGGGAGGIPLPADVSALLDRLFEPAAEDPLDLAEPAAAVEPNPPPVDADAGDDARAEPPSDTDAAGQDSGPSTGRVQASIAVSLQAASGVQPRAALGPGLQLRVAWPRRLVVLADAAVALPATEGVPGSSGELRQHTWFWRIALCGPELPLGESQLALCVRGGPVLLTAAGRGFAEDNTTARALFGEVGPHARLRRRLVGRLHLVVGLTVPVRIAPPVFRAGLPDGNTQLVREVARAGVLGELGLSTDLR